MQAYHFRIVLQRKELPSSSQTQNTDCFIPTSLFQPLPAHSPRSTAKRRNTLFGFPKQDYRFGPIRIDWMDFKDTKKSAFAPAKQERDGSRGPAEAIFMPHSRSNKSGTTNLPEGIVHIFRDSANKPSIEEVEAGNLSTSSLRLEEEEGVTLGVLAVPSWMTPSDFLAFVAPAADGIVHLRIIRDFASNRSIVVIKISSPANAAEFVEAYNGKPFNSMEPEICHVVHVLSIAIQTDDVVSQSIARFSSPQGSAYELPTCPVCLERMDSAVTGLITVPCSHTFHCMCLSKWGDSRCPVCRYSQTLLSSHPTRSTSSHPIPFSNPSIPPLSSCSSCSSTTNLWICLICGNIGCGRYGQAHAQAHYHSTTHLYALELETQRVWDYAGDGYVHRLIQNKADGKLVELPSAASSTSTAPRDGSLGPTQADALSAEKIEAIGIEYSYLLTSQLDSQRSYYEEQNAELKVQVSEMKRLLENFSKEFEMERQRAKEEAKLRKAEHEEAIAALTREKTRMEHRAEKAFELVKKFEKNLSEEKAVSEGLLKNIRSMKEKLELSEKEKQESVLKIADLEDQVRDIMFFVDAKTKIEQGGGIESEAAGGSLEIPVPLSTSKNQGKKKNKKKKDG